MTHDPQHPTPDPTVALPAVASLSTSAPLGAGSIGAIVATVAGAAGAVVAGIEANDTLAVASATGAMLTALAGIGGRFAHAIARARAIARVAAPAVAVIGGAAPTTPAATRLEGALVKSTGPGTRDLADRIDGIERGLAKLDTAMRREADAVARRLFDVENATGTGPAGANGPFALKPDTDAADMQASTVGHPMPVADGDDDGQHLLDAVEGDVTGSEVGELTERDRLLSFDRLDDVALAPGVVPVAGEDAEGIEDTASVPDDDATTGGPAA